MHARDHVVGLSAMVGELIGHCIGNYFKSDNSSDTKKEDFVLCWATIGFVLGVFAGVKINHYIHPDALLDGAFEEEPIEETLDEEEYPKMSIKDLKKIAKQIENEYEQQLREVGFDGDIPEEFLDKITNRIMMDPVVLITKDLQNSHTYDRSTYVDMIVRNIHLDPFSKEKFNDCFPNRELKEAIKRWVQEQVAARKNERDQFSFAKVLSRVGQFAGSKKPDEKSKEAKLNLRRSWSG